MTASGNKDIAGRYYCCPQPVDSLVGVSRRAYMVAAAYVANLRWDHEGNGLESSRQ